MTANATTTAYTVPSGRTATFQLVTLMLSSTGTGTVIIRLNSTTVNPIGFYIASGTPQPYETLRGLRMDPADVLSVSVPANCVCYIAGFGSLLDGAPA